VESFLSENDTFYLEPVLEQLKVYKDEVNIGLIEESVEKDCLQLLTNEGISDGFFIARMRKEV